MTYSDVSLMIDGAWTKGANGRTIPVINPATEEVIGQVAHAEKSDLDRALAAADKGFRQWRKVSAYERYKIMRKAADLMRQRLDDIATMMTTEQGKPLAEAKGEILYAAGFLLSFVSTYLSIAFIFLLQLDSAIAPRLGRLWRM